MNEAETRAELIDPALRAAGWGVVADSRVRREKPRAEERECVLYHLPDHAALVRDLINQMKTSSDLAE